MRNSHGTSLICGCWGFFCVLFCFQSTNSVPGGPKSWAQLNGKPAGQEGGEYEKQEWSCVCACFSQTSMRWGVLCFFLSSLSRLVWNGTQLSWLQCFEAIWVLFSVCVVFWLEWGNCICSGLPVQERAWAECAPSPSWTRMIHALGKQQGVLGGEGFEGEGKHLHTHTPTPTPPHTPPPPRKCLPSAQSSV